MCQRIRLGRVIVVVCLLLVVTTMSSAQTSKGTVSGVVTDPTGAVVANAKVVLTQNETNAVRETLTNDAGLYRFDAANLGTYHIAVTASGFGKASVDGVVVRANQNSAQDFVLSVGGNEQTVEVSAAASAVALQTEEQLRGANLQASTLANLPISGQNSLNLMTLIPGVVPTNLSGGGSLDSGIGSVNGARPRSNNFMIDGVENNDVSVAGPALSLANNDAIQEVSVQTSNYSAEFGRSGGAVINQITKSGTNNVHGTAAWVYRSEALNASTFDERYNYDEGGGRDAGDPLKNKFLIHLPAFTVGGPVYIPGVYNGKNKTFFFVAGQWDRENYGQITRTVTVPTAAGITTLQALAPKCPNAALYLSGIGGLVAPSESAKINISVPNTPWAGSTQSVYDLAGTCNGDPRTGMTLSIGPAVRSDSSLYKGNTIQSRVDHVFSEKHQINFRFMSAPGGFPGVATLGMAPTFDSGYTQKSYTGAISDTYVVNSHITNELRLNYFRMAYDWPILAKAGSLGATMPLIAITNMTTLGTSSSYPQGRTFNNYELQETMTWVNGKHTVRYGLDVNKQIARQIAPMPVRGTIGYTDSFVPDATGKAIANTTVRAFANFLDDWSGKTTSAATKQFGTAVYHPTVLRSSYFIQDSWKINPDLTLNMGLRYDRFGQPANDNFPFPAVSLDPTKYPNDTRIPADNNNFGPNLGFAYNPHWGLFADGKTVIRGGFQVGYDGFYNNLLSNMATGAPNNPSNLAISATPSASAPRGKAGVYGTLFPSLVPAPFTNPMGDNASQFTSTIRNPYTMHYSFGVQREVSKGMVVDFSYVGSQSRKLFISRELNPYYYDPATGVRSATRLNPNEGSRTVRDSAANANYNSMQIDFRHRTMETMVGGLTFSSSYTWSHNLDMGSETFQTSSGGSAYASSRWMALKDGLGIDYGNSDLDRRHRWVSTFMWDIRGPMKGVLRQVFGGWSITASIPIMSGTSFTVLNGFDRDADGSVAADRPDVGNPNAPLFSRGVLNSVFGTTCASGLYDPEADACTTADKVRWVMSGALPGAATARRNSAFSPGMINMDMNLMKKFEVREGMNLEFRAEMFNVMNHMNFNYAPTGLNGTGLSMNSEAGAFAPLKTEPDFYTGPGYRSIRLGAKFIF